MAKTKQNAEREKRIDLDIVVDCYDEDERAISPLRVKDEVEVIDMPPEEVCARGSKPKTAKISKPYYFNWLRYIDTGPFGLEVNGVLCAAESVMPEKSGYATKRLGGNFLNRNKDF